MKFNKSILALIMTLLVVASTTGCKRVGDTRVIKKQVRECWDGYEYVDCNRLQNPMDPNMGMAQPVYPVTHPTPVPIFIPGGSYGIHPGVHTKQRGVMRYGTPKTRVIRNYRQSRIVSPGRFGSSRAGSAGNTRPSGSFRRTLGGISTGSSYRSFPGGRSFGSGFSGSSSRGG